MNIISLPINRLDDVLLSNEWQYSRLKINYFRIGDVKNVYIEQPSPIRGKPIRKLTSSGKKMATDRIYGKWCYPNPTDILYESNKYWAHYIGQVSIVDVYTIIPDNLTRKDFNRWVDNEHLFDILTLPEYLRYFGKDWKKREWTVVECGGWIEKYFEPDSK